MAHLIPFGGKEPRVDPNAFVAPTAVLIGDVVVEEGASVWFGVVMRGDFNRIHVGANSSVQDNSVLHTFEREPTVVGRNVTVGHLSMLEGCTVEDDSIVGMASVVLNHARVGSRTILAAGSVVREGMEIPSGMLAAGVPAKVKRETSERDFERIEEATREYARLGRLYMGQAEVLVGDEKGGSGT